MCLKNDDFFVKSLSIEIFRILAFSLTSFKHLFEIYLISELSKVENLHL